MIHLYDRILAPPPFSPPVAVRAPNVYAPCEHRVDLRRVCDARGADEEPVLWVLRDEES